MRFEAVLLATCSLLAAAGSDEFSTGAGTVRITPIQHASVMLQAAGKVIYIDPAEGSYEQRPAADLILITDIHGDHFSPAVLSKLRRPDTTVFAPAAVAQKLEGATVIRNGETRRWGAWAIEAVPMYNLKRGPGPGRVYHEKGRGNGYILTFGNTRFYFAGDTEGIPEMRKLRSIDVAFVPMNLPYTMTPEEAADAVRDFRPRVVYPYHYRGSDLTAFQRGLAGTEVEVRIRDWYGK